MGLKDKLNEQIGKTLDKSEELIKKSKEQFGSQSNVVTPTDIKVGTKPCVACGAPVATNKISCDYCTTVNENYNGSNFLTDTTQVIDSTVVINNTETNAPSISCPYCNSPMVAKKKRSVGKHTIAAMATGGLSLATLAIPNKKYTCATCGKKFKIDK